VWPLVRLNHRTDAHEANEHSGGLTRGRGISSSVLARWTTGMVYMLNICEEVERFCGIHCATSEQYVHMRPSQIIRDSNDAEKLKSCFHLHPQFPVAKDIVSISSGIVGGAEVNCYMA
jgi:hypothetical protein